MRSVYVCFPRARQQLSPDCRAVFPSRAEATVMTIGDFVDVLEAERRNGLCDQRADAQQDESGVGIGSRGMPCQHQSGPSEFGRR